MSHIVLRAGDRDMGTTGIKLFWLAFFFLSFHRLLIFGCHVRWRPLFQKHGWGALCFLLNFEAPRAVVIKLGAVKLSAEECSCKNNTEIKKLEIKT